MRCVTYCLVPAAVTGSSTLYVWWGWAGLWTDCGTVYTQRWCPPPSAACVSAGWCLQDGEAMVTSSSQKELQEIIQTDTGNSFSWGWLHTRGTEGILERKKNKELDKQMGALSIQKTCQINFLNPPKHLNIWRSVMMLALVLRAFPASLLSSPFLLSLSSVCWLMCPIQIGQYRSFGCFVYQMSHKFKQTDKLLCLAASVICSAALCAMHELVH